MFVYCVNHYNKVTWALCVSNYRKTDSWFKKHYSSVLPVFCEGNPLITRGRIPIILKTLRRSIMMLTAQSKCDRVLTVQNHFCCIMTKHVENQTHHYSFIVLGNYDWDSVWHNDILQSIPQIIQNMRVLNHTNLVILFNLLYYIRISVV